MVFQYSACGVCKNPPSASCSLRDDCSQIEITSWGGIMTTYYLVCTLKKDGNGSLPHRGNTENASIAAYLKETPAIGHSSTKWLLLSFQASLEPHWHMHIKTFAA